MKSKKIAALIIGMTMTGTFAACSAQNNAAQDISAASIETEVNKKTETSENPETRSVQIANPFIDADSFEKAAESCRCCLMNLQKVYLIIIMLTNV